MAGGQNNRARRDLIEVKDIARAANGRAGELARYLLPNGKLSGDRRHWETNSLDDCPRPDGGHSLKVELGGRNAGQWRDYATGSDFGDMIDLANVRRFGGGDSGKKEAIKWLRSWCGLDTLDPARLAQVRRTAHAQAQSADVEAEKLREARRHGAIGRWMSAAPLAGSPAERYLEGRGLRPRIDPATGEIAWPGSLRYHAEVWHSAAKLRLPAMVATMGHVTGTQRAAHTTWLGRDPDTGGWVKAEQDPRSFVPAKESKKVLGPVTGSFIRIARGASGKRMSALADDAGETVYVTEGIEDALVVAMALPEARVIAAYSVENIGRIEFPPGIATVVIAMDRDKPKLDRHGKWVTPALDTLERAVARQQARGAVVRLALPPEGYKDMNAWLSGAAAQSNGQVAA